MLPSLVDAHKLGLLEPLHADICNIEKPQNARGKAASRLSKEVNALRITGQAMQDQVAQLKTQITKLTTQLEEIQVSQVAP